MLTDLSVALAGDYDVTVVTSRALYNDPLLNTGAVSFKGGRVVNWLQDLFPEITNKLLYCQEMNKQS
jgi:hypothetical protein